ncbi:hypothetical protein J6590_063784 [Homalodisca vitripennis]|nr:hypothetical protein J6590_063784 [Homalodisca vitripennis]
MIKGFFFDDLRFSKDIIVVVAPHESPEPSRADRTRKCRAQTQITVPSTHSIRPTSPNRPVPISHIYGVCNTLCHSLMMTLEQFHGIVTKGGPYPEPYPSGISFTPKSKARLVSDTFSDLTPGICSHVRLKRSNESRRRRGSNRFDIRDTYKWVKWQSPCLTRYPLCFVADFLWISSDEHGSSLRQRQILVSAIKGSGSEPDCTRTRRGKARGRGSALPQVAVAKPVRFSQPLRSRRRTFSPSFLLPPPTPSSLHLD